MNCLFNSCLIQVGNLNEISGILFISEKEIFSDLFEKSFHDMFGLTLMLIKMLTKEQVGL